jgi:hypothetical protein
LYLTSFDTKPLHYSAEQTRRFYKDVLDKTRSAPGVRSAALTSAVPLANGFGSTACFRRVMRCRAVNKFRRSRTLT